MANTTYATVTNLMTTVHDDPALTIERGQDLLNAVAAQLDSTLVAAGYSVPLTGERDLLLVRSYIVNKAAAMFYRETYHDRDTPDHVEVWEQQWERFLMMLAEGRMRLPDQTISTGVGLSTGRLLVKNRPLSTEWDA